MQPSGASVSPLCRACWCLSPSAARLWVHSWALPLAPGKNGPGREPAAPRACRGRPAGGSGGALSPGPGPSHPREEVTTTEEDSSVDGVYSGEDPEGALGRAMSCSSHQPAQTPALASGRPPRGWGANSAPAVAGATDEMQGKKAGAVWPGGCVETWQEGGVAEAGPPAVAPGVPRSGQCSGSPSGAPVGGARGECRSGQLAITSQSPTRGRPQCKADTPNTPTATRLGDAQ